MLKKFAVVCSKHQVVKHFEKWQPIKLLYEAVKMQGVDIKDVELREQSCPQCQEQREVSAQYVL